jgi:hypothetical protein
MLFRADLLKHGKLIASVYCWADNITHSRRILRREYPQHYRHSDRTVTLKIQQVI